MTRDIVYIDDDPEPLLGVARSVGVVDRIADYIPTHLRDAARDAVRANLWVFDFFTNESERTAPSVDVQASNGLSVFHQFRRIAGEARPPAVLISNDLEAALGGNVDLARRHVVAEKLGVEWVSSKVGPGSDPIKEIVSLAEGVATLRRMHAKLADAPPAEYVSALSAATLKLPRRAAWARTAITNVSEWRPPVEVTSNASSKIVASVGTLATRPQLRLAREIVAWLVRQVLPHPSFLVREPHLAVRLGITLDCLREAMTAESGLAKRLESVRYAGVLADFDGSRWWAAGIDAIAWEFPREADVRSSFLARLIAPASLQELTDTDPVVVSNSDLVETDEIAPVADCVRASDEYFPPQAPPSWVKIADARVDRALARRVRLEDQSELAER